MVAIPKLTGLTLNPKQLNPKTLNILRGDGGLREQVGLPVSILLDLKKESEFGLEGLGFRV